MANRYTAKPIPPKQDLMNLYMKNNMAQIEIAEFYGVSQKMVWGWIKKIGLHKKKIAVKRNQFGIMNSYWSGDNPEYTALHHRVEIKYGKPNECEWCNNSTNLTNRNLVNKKKKKSRQNLKKYDWCNISGEYLNVDDFIRLCKSCHRFFDKYRKWMVM